MSNVGDRVTGMNMSECECVLDEFVSRCECECECECETFSERASQVKSSHMSSRGTYVEATESVTDTHTE